MVAGTPFELSDWVVDPAANRLHRNDTEVRLEPKVMRVLEFLAERRGQVVSRRELEAGVWPGMLVSDDAVTNTVIKLRKALGDEARAPRYIETIAKTGYRLIAEISPVSVEPLELGREETSVDAPAVVETSVERDESERPPVALIRGRWPWVLGLAVLIAATIAWFVGRSPNIVSDEAAVARAERPVIAVLPFENLTADPEQNYFSDGITEDLITELSKLSGLQVVARNSVFPYRDNAPPESQIGRELGARFIVKGSVQRAGSRLRINVRLTDAIEGRNRWAERYDRELSDIFAVQDEITARVASALQIELAPGEQQRLTRKYTISVEAYDQFLQGLDLLGRRSGPDNAEAKAHFERAIELQPDFARAYAGLAQAYSQDAVYTRGPIVVQSLATAERLARRGLEIDESVPQLRYVMAMVEMFKGNLAAAIAEVSRAIDLKPSYADGYGLLARILHFAGRPEEGLEALDQAIKLNPRVPSLYRMVKGALLYQMGEDQRALQQLQASVEASPNLLLSRLTLAAVYAANDQLDAASWEVEEILANNSSFTLNDLDYGFPIRDPVFRDRFLADLQRAGLGY